MNYMPRLKQAGRVFLLLVGLCAAAVPRGWAQRPLFKTGEVILYCQPGTPRQAVDQVAAKVNAISVDALLLKDCYRLVLPEDKHTQIGTTSAVAQLKMDPRTRWAGTNKYYYPLQAKTEPNDPRYVSQEQWNLRMMRMPEAWVLQKGAAGVNLAIVDTGYRPQHEDVQGRFHSLSRDVADNDNDITANAPNLANNEDDHGTHVSGVFIARTNNGVGIASICWENIQCVGIKAYADNQATGGFPGAVLLNAYAYVAANRQAANIVALNLSLAGPGDPNDTNAPDYVALKQLVDAGIMVVAGAGNSNAETNQFTPAGFPFVVSVAAVGPDGRKASYSNFGKIEIAAPGGEQSTGNANGILSTDENNTYTFAQGTSDAAPHVTGVAGLLFSIPGVTRQIAEQAIKDTANRTGLNAVPDRDLGYGIIDAFAALARVSVRVDIIEPFGTDPQGNTNDPTGVAQPVETLNPIIRLNISNVPLSASDGAEHLVITVDGQKLDESLLLQSVESGTTTGTFPSYTLAFRMPQSSRRIGEHTILVQGNNPNTNTTTSDQMRFVITPHMIPAGTSFISIPFFENASDSPSGQFREALQLLGNDATLFRWIYTPVQNNAGQTIFSGRYATLNKSGGELPDNAKFRVPDTIPSANAPNPVSDIRPVGLAYFITTPSAIPVTTFGIDFSKQSVRVPLHEGWNMVGDPYPYPVPFNTVLIEDSTGNRFTAQQAVDQKLLLPYIYRFIGGEYNVQQLPNGLFAPWEGHWIFIRPRNPNSPNANNVVTMIFAPTRAGTTSRSRAADSTAKNGTNLNTISSQPTVSGPGSWKLRLEARTGDLSDSRNFIGMTTRATDGEDLTKVPKPPTPAPFVTLGISRPNSPNGLGLYAQDMRPIGGTKTWDVVVNTDQVNSDVTLAWPDVRGVPKNYRLTLTDKVTGQTVDLRNQSSYKYNAGRSAGPRTFLLTARPTGLNGRALVTNVFVNPTRSNGRSTPLYEIGYSVSQDVRVEISVLSFGGRTLAQVGSTRAVNSGDNRTVWNGKDSAGRDLPAGTYVLQVRAITTEGDVTREIRPLVLTGR
jgi:serine protease